MVLTDALVQRPDLVITPGELASPGRSPGVHLSDIIRSVAFRARLLDEEDMQEFNAVRMALGCAFEDWYAQKVLKPKVHEFQYHPGEWLTDGIAGTPDGVALAEDGAVWVHEVKTTWKSTNRDIHREWMWWAQLKGYCRMVGTNLGMLHVYFVNGDYHGSGPLVLVWAASFSALELQENWELILRNKRLGDQERSTA